MANSVNARIEYRYNWATQCKPIIIYNVNRERWERRKRILYFFLETVSVYFTIIHKYNPNLDSNSFVSEKYLYLETKKTMGLILSSFECSLHLSWFLLVIFTFIEQYREYRIKYINCPRLYVKFKVWNRPSKIWFSETNKRKIKSWDQNLVLN